MIKLFDLKKSLLSLVLLLPIVSAQEVTNFDLVKYNFVSQITDVLSSAKLNPATLTPILLGVLLWIIIYSIVDKVFGFEGRLKGIWSGAISLIIVILTFIYVPENFIQSIALQYSAMGAAILTMVPFIIMLYFTVVINKSLLVARASWGFYIMYYFAIFLFKTATTQKFWSADNIPYFGAIIAGIFVFFGIKEARKLLLEGKLESKEEKAIADVKLRAAMRNVEREEAKERFKNK